MSVGWDPFYWYEHELDKEYENYMKELEEENDERRSSVDICRAKQKEY